jgi:uncharacterized membrane protein YvlD (DUF360 family)
MPGLVVSGCGFFVFVVCCISIFLRKDLNTMDFDLSAFIAAILAMTLLICGFSSAGNPTAWYLSAIVVSIALLIVRLELRRI